MFHSRRLARRFFWSRSSPPKTSLPRRNLTFSETKRQVRDEKQMVTNSCTLRPGRSRRKKCTAPAPLRRRHSHARRIQQAGGTGRQASQEKRWPTAFLFSEARRPH